MSRPRQSKPLPAFQTPSSRGLLGFWWHGNEDPGGPLSDAELRELMRLLARYAERELDVWDGWKIHTSYEPVYVIMTQGLPPGWSDEAFTTTWPLPAHLKEDQRGNGNHQQQ